MTTSRFYAVARDRVFGGRMSQEQVDGVARILGAIKEYRPRPDRQRAASILATGTWETGRRMQPVREGFADSDEKAIAIVTALCAQRKRKNYAAPDPVTGHSYFGRGDTQVTHASNYKKMGAALGIPLYENPSMALDPYWSARIMVTGMMRGLFTGKSLDDVSEPDTSINFVNDRAVVNGTDRAVEIGAIAEAWYDALEDVDLLEQSRTIAAARSTRKTSDIGAIISAGTLTAKGAAVVLAENPEDLIAAAQQGITLAQLLGIGTTVGAAILLGICLWHRSQANKVERVRREDYAQGTGDGRSP